MNQMLCMDVKIFRVRTYRPHQSNQIHEAFPNFYILPSFIFVPKSDTVKISRPLIKS